MGHDLVGATCFRLPFLISKHVPPIAHNFTVIEVKKISHPKMRLRSGSPRVTARHLQSKTVIPYFLCLFLYSVNHIDLEYVVKSSHEVSVRCRHRLSGHFMTTVAMLPILRCPLTFDWFLEYNYARSKQSPSRSSRFGLQFR